MFQNPTSATPYTTSEALLGLREEDVARRRLQQKGDLYKQGGWWKLRWREDVIDSKGKPRRGWSRPAWIGPCEGPQRMTEKQAARYAWENFLSRLDQNTHTPLSVVTVGEFVRTRFIPEHVAMKKKAGRIHYRAILKHLIEPEAVDAMFQVDRDKIKPTLEKVAGWPYIGETQLRDLRQDHVQAIVSAALAKGYSVQTARHIRNVASAIVGYAKTKGWFSGENPAKTTVLPEMQRRESHALTLAQAKPLIEAMAYPEREIALVSMLTSMNVAEICGLQWKRVNLTEQWATVDGEALAPLTIAVRRQWYRGELTTVKKRARSRDLPIPDALLPVLSHLRQRDKFTGPDDYVLVSRAGTPVDEHNIAARHLKPLGRRFDMPWISWHVFRRSHTTIAKELGMEFTDRMAMMGHSDARMTMLYTRESLTRRRAVLNEMGKKLLSETVQ